MSYTATATCGTCGTTHQSVHSVSQAAADSTALQKARTCANNDQIKKTYDEARKRKETELANRRQAQADRGEARRKAAEDKRGKKK